jgi:hypothetical protein
VWIFLGFGKSTAFTFWATLFNNCTETIVIIMENKKIKKQLIVKEFCIDRRA